MKSPTSISDHQSILFDAARIIATFAVFLQHATGEASLFDVKVTLLGRTVIPLFLIISGYMTAMAMARGGRFFPKLLRRYLKYYFIVIPAIFLMFAADLYLISVQSPIVTQDKFEAEHTVYTFVREAFQALTYSGEYWRQTTVSQGLFGNVAYWTMDYIMAYVVLTMAFYLLSGPMRIFVLIAAALIAGPTVMLLSPLWFAGVLAYELHRRSREENPRWLTSHLFAWACVVIGLGLILVVEIKGVGETAYLESKSWASYEYREHLGMAKRFVWQWLLVPGLFLILLASKYLLSDQPAPALRDRLRAAAFYTLPVYILHFNFVYLAQALIPDYDPSVGSIDPYLMIALSMGLTLGVSWGAIHFLQPRFDKVIAQLF
ncbi:MAG: acyltransferase family protein [Pseudomonadota bacterium]